jgi:hypothetical protein
VLVVPLASVVAKVGLMVPQSVPLKVNITGSPEIAPPPEFLTVTVTPCVLFPSAAKGAAVGLFVTVFGVVGAGLVSWSMVPELLPAVAASVAVIVQNPDEVLVV